MVPPDAVLVTTPVEVLILATDGADDVHEPPDGVQVREAVADGHIVVAPDILPGKGVTVTVGVVAL